MGFQQFKSTLPGLIPLIILILAEWLWGMVVGLWLAVAYGLGEMAYYGIRYHCFEKRTFYDTGLLVGLGLFAVIIDGPMLDRLRPIIYLSIMLLMVGISAFSKHNIIMATSGKMLKNKQFGPWEMEQVKMTMVHLFWWMILYWVILLVALVMPEQISTFFNGTGLYIFIALIMVYELIFKTVSNKRWSKEEWLPLVNKDGKIIGNAPRSEVHNGKSRWLHPVVHIQLLQHNGLWLQKRPTHKLVQPGKWDTAVGGHINAGETVQQALKREAAEEIGVEINELQHLGRYHWKTELENELVFTFLLKHENEINPNPQELDGGRFWSFEEIENDLGKEIFTQNFEYEYKLYKHILKQ